MGLFEDRRAAHHHGDLYGGAFGEHLKIVFDLNDQLTRRRKDQRADVFRPRRVAKVKDAVQQGQAKGCRLAGASLRQTHQVGAFHDMGNGLRLNGRRGFQIGLFQRLQDRRGKAEIGKSGHGVVRSTKGNRHSPHRVLRAGRVGGVTLREGGTWPGIPWSSRGTGWVG